MSESMPRAPRPLQPLLSLVSGVVVTLLAIAWFASYPPRKIWQLLRTVAPYLCQAATWTLYYGNMAALLVYVYTSLAAQGAAVRAASRVAEFSTWIEPSMESSINVFPMSESSSKLLAAQRALDALEAVTKLAARSSALTLAANIDVAIAVSDKRISARTTWAAQIVLLYFKWNLAKAWATSDRTWGPVAKIPEVGRVASMVFAWAGVGLAVLRLVMEVVWHVGRNWGDTVGRDPESESDSEAEENSSSEREMAARDKQETSVLTDGSEKPDGALVVGQMTVLEVILEVEETTSEGAAEVAPEGTGEAVSQGAGEVVLQGTLASAPTDAGKVALAGAEDAASEGGAAPEAVEEVAPEAAGEEHRQVQERQHWRVPERCS